MGDHECFRLSLAAVFAVATEKCGKMSCNHGENAGGAEDHMLVVLLLAECWPRMA